ncbi:MAG: HDOD domain-containing protein [Deltaproteobacteria bacterium]|jgi:HD-like signal output (HDOD) protein|nr:HDOD domain-containing protein [Deltaproteobacteria bacterium]
MTETTPKRILFVDDEPLVLKGLQRTLRKRRAEWDTVFAANGKEALEILDQQPMDVIVSDLKMPDMDGMQLLTKVRERHPHMVRIILSGNTEHEVTLRSVQYAHQNLTKPCDAEILKQTLAKLFALREILADESVKKIVSQIESLPSLPSIYSAIIEEMQSEDPSIKKISAIISKDLSMTAKILQVVNSVFFGLARKISSPQEAVVLLGLETIKALVLSVKIFSEFSQKNYSWFNVDDLFNHSMSVSANTKAIVKTEKLSGDLLNHSLMAGLLHDLGKLILLTNFPRPYKQVLTTARESGQNLWDMEYEAFGTSHAEIGAYLMGLWNLETPIIEAIAFHHRPANSMSENMGLLTAVHVGNAIDHNGQASANGDTGLVCDAHYLETVGVTDRLSEWCQVCSLLAERN